MSSKNRVTLTTYFKLRNETVLRRKIIEVDGTKFDVQIWCKICAKYNQIQIRNTQGIEMICQIAALAFSEGMENMKKQ